MLNFKKMYDHLLNNPPLFKDGTRRKGATVYSAFWNGYDGIKPGYIIFKSAAYYAWKAGEKYKQINKE